MTFKISDKAQTITVYNLRADTNEFIGAGDAYIPEHTGLPAHCTDIVPPDTPENMVAVFDGKAWSLFEDHRGTTVYNKSTGEKLYIEQLGALPVNAVSVAATGDFVKWDGKKWVPDADAQKASAVHDATVHKAKLLNEATQQIGVLQDAVDLGMATDEEVLNLKSWKQYRVLLNRVDVNSASDIEWPNLNPKE